MKEKVITVIIILGLVLATVLIIPDANDNNYNILKYIVLLITGGILIIILLTDYKNIITDKKDILIFVFLCLSIISTIFSSDISKSIIGETNRFEGLLMIFVYIAIYISAKKYFKIEKVKLFLSVMFYVSMLIGILGILQRNIECIKLYPIFNKGICSTFGNSNFFGSFISIILPISMATYILYGNKRAFVLSMIMFFNMIASGTRSAWVAFIVVGVYGSIFLINKRDKQYLKRTIILILIFVIIFIYLFSNLNFWGSGDCVTKIKMNQLKNDLKKITQSGFSNEMGSGRIEIWRMTFKLIAKKPIIGCGVDNLKISLANECTDELAEFALKTFGVVDKAHNEYLQIAATMGIPSLIIYLIFVLLILIPKLRLIFKDDIAFIISLTIISYLVQAFFNISTIGVAPLYWLILGISDRGSIIKKES